MLFAMIRSHGTVLDKDTGLNTAGYMEFSEVIGIKKNIKHEQLAYKSFMSVHKYFLNVFYFFDVIRSNHKHVNFQTKPVVIQQKT